MIKKLKRNVIALCITLSLIPASQFTLLNNSKKTVTSQNENKVDVEESNEEQTTLRPSFINDKEAMSSLVELTGIFSSIVYEKELIHFQTLANSLNEELIYTDDYKIKNSVYTADLYNFLGENQYLEVSFRNKYAILNKENNEIVESSFSDKSPYSYYRESLGIYSDDGFSFKHVIYSKGSFVDIDNQTIIEGKEIKTHFALLSATAGKYEDIRPGAGAHVISNAFYFENLHKNHAINRLGTCTIVAAQILFGYYDTFHNDFIIDEEYDTLGTSFRSNSDNIRNIEESPGSDDSSLEVSTFHDSLVEMAKYYTNDDPEIDGMSVSNQLTLVKKYLGERHISFSQHTAVNNLTDILDQRARKIIKEAIDANRPVISNGTGHSTVAYAYDDEYVYVHTGWGWAGRTSWSTYTDINNYEKGAIDIVIESPQVHSDNYYSNYHNIYMCPCGVTMSNAIIKPIHYGYEQQYFFSKEEKQVSVGNFSFNTFRLRTGYIENEYINLSPKRANAGSAYLEYYFNKPVTKVTMNLSLWSGAEGFNKNEDIAWFMKRTSRGDLFVAIDLFNEITLSTNRYNQGTYTVAFGESIYFFGFYVYSSAVGSTNKGRISIGDMKIQYLN